MALEADSPIGALDAPEPIRIPRLPFWTWRAALLLELILSGVATAIGGLGTGISVAIAGLFLCAFLSFLALQSWSRRWAWPRAGWRARKWRS